jgi:hypothetical protein
MTVAVGYRHRQLSDGTWDSICLRCYATVANTNEEERLARYEQMHLCVHPLPGERVH